MTKRVYVTNLKEIASLRIVCAKCKSEMVVPIGVQNPPEQCFGCRAQLPWQDINRAIKGINTTNQASRDYGAFEAFFETKEDGDSEPPKRD